LIYVDDDTWIDEKCWRKVDDDSTRNAPRASLNRANEKAISHRKLKGEQQEKQSPVSRSGSDGRFVRAAGVRLNENKLTSHIIHWGLGPGTRGPHLHLFTKRAKRTNTNRNH